MIEHLAPWLIMIVAAYLLGSIPFALLIGRARGVDIRLHGSGNVGASNVGRLLGRRMGMLCFVLDLGKGFVPVAMTGIWFGWWAQPATALTAADAFMWMAVGVAAILGHMFSMFLGFRGGKGVATGFGFMLGVYPHLTWPALGALAVWLLTLKLTRFISLSSMLAAISMPVWILIVSVPRDFGVADGPTLIESVQPAWPFMALTGALALLVVIKHRSNLKRLVAGVEPKVGQPLNEDEAPARAQEKGPRTSSRA
ncbi:MAG: glycerol-3-phosphate 1-O-acyltransferase PlsY [Phycisphaerales bacterium]